MSNVHLTALHLRTITDMIIIIMVVLNSLKFQIIQDYW